MPSIGMRTRSRRSRRTASGGILVLAERLIRRALQAYWRHSRGLTMGAQGIVLDRDDRVLLIRRTDRPGWHVPGGSVDKGETVEETLRRALRQEVGVTVEGTPELLGLYADPHFFPGDHVALFVVRAWRQEAWQPTAGIAEQGLFAAGALPDALVAPARDRLREILAGRPRSPQGPAP